MEMHKKLDPHHSTELHCLVQMGLSWHFYIEVYEKFVETTKDEYIDFSVHS